MAQSRAEDSRASAVGRTLFARAKGGDCQALGELLEQFRPALQDLARQLLSPALAQKVGASDLVQETCLDAMRDFKASRVEHHKGLEAWMVTLLANNLKDWQRKFKSSQKRDVRRERRLGDADSQRGPLAASLAAADSGPPSRLLKQESEDLVAQALAQLPRGYQTIIIWRSEQRLSWREIAQRLDRSEDAVRMLWKRALERLKRQVREHP